MKTLPLVLAAALATAAAAPVAAQGVSLDLEFPVLDVFANHATGGNGSRWFTASPDAAAAYRLIGTLDVGGDRAVRLRYFSFDADFANPADIYEVRSADLEAVFGNSLGATDVAMFAGLRAAEISFSDENGGARHDFSGVGPTLGVEMTAPFGDSLAFFASGRYAALFGDTSSNATTASGVFASSLDIQLGLEFQRSMGNGSTLSIAGGVETNSNFGLSVNPTGNIDPEEIDITAAGVFLRAGLSF